MRGGHQHTTAAGGTKEVGGVQDYTGQKIVVIYIVLPAEGNINTQAFLSCIMLYCVKKSNRPTLLLTDKVIYLNESN